MVRTRGRGSPGAGPSNREGPRGSERSRQRRMEERLEWIKNRTIHPQRAVALDSLQGTFVTETVEALGWRQLVGDPGPFSEEFVREFYACMDSSEYRSTSIVRMRGFEIDMSAERINEFYGLQGTNDMYGVPQLPQFETRGNLALALRINDDDVWTSAHPLRTSELHMQPCFWNKFRSYNIRPSKHDHEFTDSDARIIYCIWHQIPIDVGKIIKLEINAVCDDKNVILPFPSLICRFIQAAGIDVFGSRLRFWQPMGSLGRQAYNRMANQRGFATLPSRYMAQHARRLAREAEAQVQGEDEEEAEAQNQGGAQAGEEQVPPPQDVPGHPAWVTQILDGQRAILDGQRAILDGQRALQERFNAEFAGLRDRITVLEEWHRNFPHGGGSQ